MMSAAFVNVLRLLDKTSIVVFDRLADCRKTLFVCSWSSWKSGYARNTSFSRGCLEGGWLEFLCW